MNKRTLLLWAFAGFIGTMGLSAQEITYSKMSPSTLRLLNQVAKKDTSDSQLRSIMSENKLSAFVQVEDESGWDALYAAGCEVKTRVDDMATVRIPLPLVEKLSEHPGIGYIQAAEKVSFQMDSALRVSDVQPAHVGTGLSHPYTGKGVLVGVVDIGFDFKHPNFYDKSGKNYRIKRVWDQKRPEGQQEFTTQEAILAAGQSADSETKQHGTHVSGIAVGSGADTPYKGVAPESELLLVATTMQDADIVDGVNYIFQQAEASGKPCVVNLSLGGNIGPHDGTAIFDQMLDKAVGPGKIITVAMGNERGMSLYAAALSAADTLHTFIAPNKSQVGVDIWADQPGEKFTYSLSLCEKKSNTVISSTGFLPLKDSPSGTVYFEMWSKDSTRMYKIQGNQQLYKENGKYNMQLLLEYPVNIMIEEAILLEVATKKSPVRAWCFQSAFSDQGLGAPYKAGTGEYSIASPASAHEVISVGAYVSRDSISNIFGQKGRTNEVYNELASFSSVGPTIDNRIKPDVSAPGSSVYSSFNSVYMENNGDSTYMVATSKFEGNTYPWGRMDGTSMACPFVTGSIALWLQANPALTPEDIKKVLSRTSVKDKKITYPNSLWGAGKIDVHKGLLDILNITSNENILADSPEEAVCVYAGQTPGSFHIRWANMPKAFSVHLYGMDSRHWYGEKVNDPVSIDYTVSAGNVPAGVYVVTISTADGLVTRKISFK